MSAVLKNYHRPYTNEEKLKARKWRGKAPRKEIAALLGRTIESLSAQYRAQDKYDDANRRCGSALMPNKTANFYRQGRKAYMQGKPIKSCPHSEDVNLAEAIAWKAGWHDQDMAMGNSIIEGRL